MCHFYLFSLVGYIVGCDVAGAAAEGLLPPVRPAQDAGEQAAHPREGQQTGKLYNIMILISMGKTTVDGWYMIFYCQWVRFDPLS